MSTLKAFKALDTHMQSRSTPLDTERLRVFLGIYGSDSAEDIHATTTVWASMREGCPLLLNQTDSCQPALDTTHENYQSAYGIRACILDALNIDNDIAN